MPRNEKDMKALRETESFKNVMKRHRAFLKDYSMKYTVEMHWDLNGEAMRDRMFVMKIGDNEAIIDLEELLSYTRAV